MLGWQVYKALIDDLDVSGEPQTQKYIDLVDGIELGYTEDEDNYIELAGILEMLPYFFYYYYVKDVQGHNTEVGDVSIDVTNSSKSIYARNQRMVNAYEKGRDLYNQLINYCLYKNHDSSDYYRNFTYKELESANIYGI